MRIMFYKSIYEPVGTLKNICDISELVSDKPKEKAPLYGAFISNGERKISSIKYRTAITVDIDRIIGDDPTARAIIQRTIDYLDSLFNSWVLHETHSSKPNDRRVRIIIPTPCITTANYKYFATAFLNDFKSKVDTENIIVIDKKSYEPQQLMYLIPARVRFAGRLGDDNNVDWIIEEAKQLKAKEPPKRVYIPRNDVKADNYYTYLEQMGMEHFVEKYFQDKYQFVRNLRNGEKEYKDLNSKKKAGVRITKDNQVLVSWHDGDEYLQEGNGARRANIYQLLKSKDLNTIEYELWKSQR